MGVRTPPLEALTRLLDACHEAGVAAALGGSALLASRGLVDVVRDWDVTTDASETAVERVVNQLGLPVHDRTIRHEPYRTRRLLTIDAHDHSIDIIVGFALLAPDGTLVELPSRVSTTWKGLPIADPAVWYQAYRLLRRDDRAELLRRHSPQLGADDNSQGGAPPATSPPNQLDGHRMRANH